jgi:hypothetical protein
MNKTKKARQQATLNADAQIEILATVEKVDLVSILQKMIDEAKAGNVDAARLVFHLFFGSDIQPLIGPANNVRDAQKLIEDHLEHLDVEDVIRNRPN